jgi:glycine/D-amino acid oxidase-like deaminating enzyme
MSIPGPKRVEAPLSQEEKSLSASKQVAALPQSLWAATAGPPLPHTELAHDDSADVCVVGGGFTGLSTALHAAEAGARVVLLEAAEPGWGASGRNGGQVIPGLKWDPDELERLLGTERGSRLVGFVGSAPDLVFALIERHRIACSARREGWIHAVHGPAALAAEESRVRQWSARGAAIEMLDRDAVATALGTRDYLAGALDRRGGWLQPLGYARGLARAAREAGASIHGGSPATDIRPAGDGWRVETDRAAVSARQVFVCTNAYTGGLWPRLSRSLVPLVSYQAATEPLSETLRSQILSKGHVASDTRRLLRYFCMDPEGRLVMGGRGRFRTTETREAYRHVETSLRQVFPEAARAKLEFCWSGQVALTLDSLPHLHELEPGLWFAGGYNGRGVALATAMGPVLARLAGGARAEELPLPPSPVRPIPFHRLRRPAIELAVAWKRALDAWESPR